MIIVISNITILQNIASVPGRVDLGPGTPQSRSEEGWPPDVRARALILLSRRRMYPFLASFRPAQPDSQILVSD